MTGFSTSSIISKLLPKHRILCSLYLWPRKNFLKMMLILLMYRHCQNPIFTTDWTLSSIKNLKWYIVDVRWTDMQCLNSQGTITLCLLPTFSHYQTSAIPWQDIFKLLKDLQPCCKEQSIAQSTKISCMKTAQLHAKP